ncbi:glycosyltransferase family 50 protein [Trichoderma citrinoviride]|uniref:GPI mannosyltransferase 1 n=1 Tax=Trichoderma citrinoviride TaxID=58853 RepID=A0A2T4BHR2_9HYPO|nr:glycosyltransferase family 50 protein [Trichoderma citrinoviride]PTB68789.1 glycosyltransferase family 50 protein [Trichoderma citrinoviride]
MPSSSLLTPLFRPAPLFSLAALLRLVLLLYGTWQDAHSAVKYTDIDYLVFTDAARAVSRGLSPYARETYRYTPLLAWLLVPTAAAAPQHPFFFFFFSFGKIVFALADLLAGWLIVRVLRKQRGMSAERAGAFAAIWLWNPMVATISTRGSSEGLLGVLTMALLWAVEGRRIGVAGVVLGLSVHFKIYPFIYAPAIIWWMDDEHLGKKASKPPASSFAEAVLRFVSPERIKLTLISLSTFMGLNALMYYIYGTPFLTHSYLHHVTRIDHRHNFSPYNIYLYLASANPSSSSLHAFLPQLLLSCLLIPFVLAKKDLATSMMAQTFAFVTFNKVCTSQYFLWYMIFLPVYLPGSSMLRVPRRGITALLLWVLGQAAWLQQGYELEFLGVSTFFPGLWLASLAFFLINCWILGIIISDGAERSIQPKVHTM